MNHYRFVGLLLALPSLLMAAPHSIQVHGHRGARARFPENTIPAFKHALEVGVDALEMDMAVTRDGVIVISHDPRINPVICRRKDGAAMPEPAPLIHDLTLKQVKEYDCGAIRNPKFPDQDPVPGTELPTLAEVFAFVKSSKAPVASHVLFNIETKINPARPEETVSPEVFAKKVIDEVRKAGLLKRIILQSFDPRTLVEARKLVKDLQISLLIEDPKIDMVPAAKMIRANVVSPDFNLLTAEKVKALHDAKLSVLPWTVDRSEDWGRLIGWGVDGIITDDPEKLLQYLGERKLAP